MALARGAGMNLLLRLAAQKMELAALDPRVENPEHQDPSRNRCKWRARVVGVKCFLVQAVPAVQALQVMHAVQAMQVMQAVQATQHLQATQHKHGP